LLRPAFISQIQIYNWQAFAGNQGLSSFQSAFIDKIIVSAYFYLPKENFLSFHMSQPEGSAKFIKPGLVDAGFLPEILIN